jgi:cobalamin-dependent methionine synthase I
MTQDNDARVRSAKIADALVDDIMATSDIDIVAEVDKGDIERARVLFVEAKRTHSQQRLRNVRKEFEQWKSKHVKDSSLPNSAIAKRHFGNVIRGDTEFDRKVTMAARKGEAPTEKDIDGLASDWADLRQLDGGSETE